MRNSFINVSTVHKHYVNLCFIAVCSVFNAGYAMLSVANQWWSHHVWQICTHLD